MPTIIMTKLASRVEGSLRGPAMAFLMKLSENDTAPGLHIEPIKRAADPRVRTGRVNDSVRAVMFRLDSGHEPHYVIHGFWPHDRAIEVASRAQLTVNPVNGLPVIEERAAAAPATQVPAPPARPTPVPEAFLTSNHYLESDLTDQLGLPPETAAAAMAAPDADALLQIAQAHEGWIGDTLLDLAVATPLGDIRDRLFDLPQEAATPAEPGVSAEPGAPASATPAEPTAPASATGKPGTAPAAQADDAATLAALRRPAAGTQFAFIGDQDELRRVIEDGDFGAWRVFLHPDQRQYVTRHYRGPFRLSGAAGTGKTVILVHRACAFLKQEPARRIVLTTFTTTLADALTDQVTLLDPSANPHGTDGLGQPGLVVGGVDALVHRVLRGTTGRIQRCCEAVLGAARDGLSSRTPTSRWDGVIESAGADLPDTLRHRDFFENEYATIVLPNRITTEAEYLRVRRPGRGIALNRARRRAVWHVIAAYRAECQIDGGLDYAEAAAIAAAYLESAPGGGAGSAGGTGGTGGTGRGLADTVLIDEAQDLSAPHWQFLRALAAPGPDDLFIAEDVHQRIYGPKLVLRRLGINIVGRSRRLTLNYRTTAQVLRYAVGVLDGGDYEDIESGAPLEAGNLHSVRLGPTPVIETVNDQEAEIEVTARWLRRWLGSAGAVSKPVASKDVAPETIAILVRDRWERDRFAQALSSAGLPVRALDRGRPGVGKVLVMTMHRAKGLEFQRVILAGIGAWPNDQPGTGVFDEAERAELDLRERSLTYVAATRARDELVVLRPA